MRPDRRLSGQDLRTLRRRFSGVGADPGRAEAPHVWCSGKSRHGAYGASTGGNGNSYAAQRIGEGIDDAHFYRVDNIEKAASGIPHNEFSILLSHTPEIYRQAAHADFNVMLSGHTHGGQICVPGGIPIQLNAVLPRRLGAGAWRHHSLAGYTSVGAGASIVTVRFNCPPEITLHHLEPD
jgi:predicted MPP superfamily phosphohydrolase